MLAERRNGIYPMVLKNDENILVEEGFYLLNFYFFT